MGPLPISYTAIPHHNCRKTKHPKHPLGVCVVCTHGLACRGELLPLYIHVLFVATEFLMDDVLVESRETFIGQTPVAYHLARDAV